MHSEVFPKLNESPNNDDIIETVLSARYYVPGESSWADVVNRVSRFLADDNEKMSEFNRLLTQKKFIPNSPTLMNAGTSNPMMSACFVLPIEDDLESIMKTLHDAAFIFKSGGGVGINYSNLRPKGSKIGSTNGTASGPVSFMEMFNGMSETIKQGGKRRGAQISILDFNHPDLYDFITVKNTEGKLNNMNLSVMFKDEDIRTILKHPETMHACGKTYGELFNIIVDGIWRKGEPGCLFYDTINANVNGYKINATNPCLTYESLILTDEGYKEIGSLVNKTCRVWNGEEFSEVKPFFVKANQPIIRLSFSDGTIVDCTLDHKWFIQEGFSRDGKIVKKTSNELIVGDKLIKCDMPIIEGKAILNDAYKYGFFCGDGSSGKRNSMIVYPTKEMCFEEEAKKHGKKYVNVSQNWSKSFVPDVSYNVESRKEWLAGLCDSDGCKTKDGGIQITSIDKKFLMEVKLMLNTMGCMGKITLNKNETVKPMPNGKGGYSNYQCKNVYRLLINKWEYHKLDLPTKRLGKYEIEPNRSAGQFVKLVSKEMIGNADVYCLTETKRHQIVVNGVPSSQCGEMVLPDYGACCLGSFDVSKYYNPEKRNLNWKEFIRDIEYAAQMLNAINEKNKYPLPEIERVARYEHPRIGMGLMGYADLLLKFGYTYGDAKSKALLQDILGTMKKVAKKTIPGLESYLSIAPTGTISIFANASSGIEPVFSWVYMRRNTLGKEFLMVHPIFDQTIKKLIACETALTPEQKEAIYREILDWAYRNGSIQKCPYLPDDVKKVYVCAMDITPDAHISTQAAAQEEVDASISKTINLPSSATHDDIRDGLLEAWSSLCKGVTMYRDGSRTEVVLDLNREAKTEGEVKGKCPECGSELERSEGCIKCHSCGWSKCG